MTTTPAMSDDEERAAFYRWKANPSTLGNYTMEDMSRSAYYQGRADERIRQAALAGEPSEQDIERVRVFTKLLCETDGKDWNKVRMTGRDGAGNPFWRYTTMAEAILSYLNKE